MVPKIHPPGIGKALALSSGGRHLETLCCTHTSWGLHGPPLSWALYFLLTSPVPPPLAHTAAPNSVISGENAGMFNLREAEPVELSPEAGAVASEG